MKDYFALKAPEEVKKRCKNHAQKKKWLVSELGVTLQNDPGLGIKEDRQHCIFAFLQYKLKL